MQGPGMAVLIANYEQELREWEASHPGKQPGDEPGGWNTRKWLESRIAFCKMQQDKEAGHGTER